MVLSPAIWHASSIAAAGGEEEGGDGHDGVRHLGAVIRLGDRLQIGEDHRDETLGVKDFCSPM